MRFAVLHQLVSYLLVGASLLALALSEELSPWVTTATFAALPLSWWVQPRPRGRWGPRLWTAATLALLAYTLLDVMVGDAPALISGVNFLLFLVVNKLFNRRTSRDYLQLYVLSFVTLVAAAALNNDLSFALCFLLYVICATWSLILLHLRREMEENYLLRHTEPDAAGKRVEVQRILHSKRIVGGKFLLSTSLLSVSIFLVSSLLFLLFPRVGFGFLFGKSQRGASIAGFSERIELGSFGVIKDNPAVVLRVEIPDLPPQARLNWRWRGISFDRYDGRTWHKERAGWKQLKRGRLPRSFLVEEGADVRRALRATVFMEPVSESNVLFTAGRPLVVQLPEKRTYAMGDPRYVRRDAHGDLSLDGDPSLSVSYTLYFTRDEPSPEKLRAARGEVPRAIARRYLQLPSLSADAWALAEKITRGHDTAYDRALALERHLRSSYGYTLEMRPNPDVSPLEDFLLVRKAGHCEYFSTAMVVLLRMLRIPARNVNGFLGGDWNRYGRFYTVRQGDAHSWVEAWLPGVGWVTFDPTPPGARGARAEDGILATISAWIDSLRLKWYKYVVEYDLAKQVGFFRGLAAWFREALSGTGLKEIASGVRDALWSPWGAVATAAALALVGWLLWRRRQRRRAPGRRAEVRRREISDLYLRLLDVLRGCGYEKPPAQTPRDFARALARQHAPVAGPVRRFTEAYNRVRFGGRPLSDGELGDLRRLVRAVGERRP